jgi:ribosomal protein L37E
MKSKVVFFLIVFLVLSCKKTESSYDQEETTSSINDETTDAYPDGTYCADIEYYNPDTGTRSTYTLNVEVESHEVKVIQWSNGGWLDSSHFNPEELDSSGSCSFSTFDGNQYDIQITGAECSSTDEKLVSGNENYEKQKITCPECGGKKYSYNDVCDDCKDKAEHTCNRCGQEDAFMFSSDDLCSDCKRADEDKEREEKRAEEESNNN